MKLRLRRGRFGIKDQMGTVRRVSRAYNVRGMLHVLSSWSDGADDMLNRVRRIKEDSTVLRRGVTPDPLMTPPPPELTEAMHV